MSTPSQPSSAIRVLTAIAGAHLLALPGTATGIIATCPCSPPPPGAAPWLGGIARWRDQLLWVLDPCGVRNGDDATREQTLVVADDGGWALAITAPSTLALATPIRTADADGAWPAGWLCSCLLDDGRRGWLADPQAIARTLALVEAA